MIPTIIASVALAVILIAALRHLISQKRSGKACMNCPVEGGCPIVALYEGKSGKAKNESLRCAGGQAVCDCAH